LHAHKKLPFPMQRYLSSQPKRVAFVSQYA
jgi:hypothetical protein